MELGQLPPTSALARAHSILVWFFPITSSFQHSHEDIHAHPAPVLPRSSAYLQSVTEKSGGPLPVCPVSSSNP